MKRRESVLLLVSLLTGCAGRGDTGNTATEQPSTPDPGDQLSVSIHPGTDEDSTSHEKQERVVVTNESETDATIRRYYLEYSSNHRYSFDRVSLAPGEKIVVVSQGSGDATLESNPPVHVRDANFPELVTADGEETVMLKNPDGKTVVDATYSGG
ncbi:MAG: lamin tail domain-containing protein [Halopenitus sp.]